MAAPSSLDLDMEKLTCSAKLDPVKGFKAGVQDHVMPNLGFVTSLAETTNSTLAVLLRRV